MNLCRPPRSLDQPVAGPQMQMVGIGQLDLAADLLQIGGAEARPLIAPCVADIHKNRRLHRAVGAGKFPRRAAPSCLRN